MTKALGTVDKLTKELQAREDVVAAREAEVEKKLAILKSLA